MLSVKRDFVEPMKASKMFLICAQKRLIEGGILLKRKQARKRSALST